jgi:argininosuccinate lyase
MIVMLDHIKITRDLTADPAYNSIFSTEEVNRLVREGMPFRDAYKKVAGMIGKGVFSKPSITEYTHEGSIGNLCNKEIREIFEERMKYFKSKSSAELIENMMKGI